MLNFTDDPELLRRFTQKPERGKVIKKKKPTVRSRIIHGLRFCAKRKMRKRKQRKKQIAPMPPA